MCAHLHRPSQARILGLEGSSAFNTKGFKDEFSTGSNNQPRSTDLFRSSIIEFNLDDTLFILVHKRLSSMLYVDGLDGIDYHRS